MRQKVWWYGDSGGIAAFGISAVEITVNGGIIETGIKIVEIPLGQMARPALNGSLDPLGRGFIRGFIHVPISVCRS